MTDVNEELLREVKELHRTIRLVHKDALKKAVKDEMVAIKKLVEGATKAGIPKRQAAYDMLDGSLSQKKISSATGMDQGNLSRMIKQLKEEDLVDVEGDNVVKRYDIDWR